MLRRSEMPGVHQPAQGTIDEDEIPAANSIALALLHRTGLIMALGSIPWGNNASHSAGVTVSKVPRGASNSPHTYSTRKGCDATDWVHLISINTRLRVGYLCLGILCM